jgi:hypothetical protein
VTVSGDLVRDLQRRVRVLEGDLRASSDDPASLWGASLRREHARAVSRGRTGLSWSVWRDGEVAQAAVAWVLATVFVRFCEDNDLIGGVWLSGPGDRLSRAVDAETAFYQGDPSRDSVAWLRAGFAELAGLLAARGVVDPEHNLVWTASIGADAARELVGFWRETAADGSLLRDFTDPELDTRFLGDLYQDLSEFAKKKYALLQTPVFVEEFILDRTLTPAVAEFGLEGLRLIDPTCGSGHFLLGAFDRLVDAWGAHAPGLTPEARVQRALDSVHGVDLNPFAVAIARFRLTVAALRHAGVRSLADAPAFTLRVAVGDSLLAGTAGRQGDLLASEDDSLASFEYASEDVSEFPGILDPGRYHVVVGNPPYITVKDKALNQAYRDVYSTCSGKYALSVPFMERFFQLARRGDASQGAGFVGQITSNSFMKREFGKKLIEEFLSGGTFETPVDLQYVIDTSGAYIPGHGTPTVILVGRTRQPVGDTVRAVLGVRGEPGQPAEPARGLVWTQIVATVDQPGSNGDYVTVTDLPRTTLSHHPWSLSGGGAGALKDAIEEASRGALGGEAHSIGIMSVTGEDSLYMLGPAGLRSGVEQLTTLVEGDAVRDFAIASSTDTLWPYERNLSVTPLETMPVGSRLLWSARSIVNKRKRFGTPMIERGLSWWEWQELYADKLQAKPSIVFAFVATHNHFVLDRGGKVFNRSAPVIKLPAGASVAGHLDLLGVLNSSVACFWLKQVSHDKGSQGVNEGFKSQAWERFFEFTGTKLQEFPLPAVLPGARAGVLDGLATEQAAVTPASALARGGVSRAALDTARAEWNRLRARMVFEQEELDWDVYRAYGLIDEDLTYSGAGIDTLALGERAFEIALARRVVRGLEETAWFERHGSTPITSPPASWPEDYRDLYHRRHDLIGDNPFVALLERPEFKRRWASRSWEELEREALREFVLDRLEDRGLWFEGGSARVLSVAQLADRVRGDGQLVEALRLLTGQEDVDLTRELSSLVSGEAVPFLAAYRYSPSGLVKRAEWEQVWALQRREDAGERVEISVPPKYASKDFAKTSYWSARGKLDVPKERFVYYPGAQAGGDATLVLGWAGWDHLEQALALAAVVVARQQEDGWDAAQLTPLLAGLAELEPWLHQWHDDPDPRFAGSPAAYLTGFLDTTLDSLGLTRAALAEWRPPAPTKGRAARARTTTTDQQETDA